MQPNQKTPEAVSQSLPGWRASPILKTAKNTIPFFSPVGMITETQDPRMWHHVTQDLKAFLVKKEVDIFLNVDDNFTTEA